MKLDPEYDTSQCPSPPPRSANGRFWQPQAESSYNMFSISHILVIAVIMKNKINQFVFLFAFQLW